MAYQRLRGKWALCALFLVFGSCTPKCDEWFVEKSITPCPEFRSAKMSMPPCNSCMGLEVELVRNCCDERMYLNVFTSAINGSDSDLTKAKVFVVIDDVPEEVYADILKGNQRVLMPPEATARVISALQDGRKVVLATGRFEEEVRVANFSEAYAKYIF